MNKRSRPKSIFQTACELFGGSNVFSGSELKLFLSVLNAIKDDPQDFHNLSRKELAEISGLSMSTVLRSGHALVQEGVLLQEDGDCMNSNRYAINLPRMRELIAQH